MAAEGYEGQTPFERRVLTELAELRGDMAEVRGDMAEVRRGQADHGDRLDRIEGKVDRVLTIAQGQATERPRSEARNVWSGSRISTGAHYVRSVTS